MDITAKVIETFLKEIGRPNQFSLTISRFRGRFGKGGKDESYYYKSLIPHKVAVYNNGLQLANLSENYHKFKNVQLIDHDWSRMAKEEQGGDQHHHFNANAHHPEYWFHTDRNGFVTLLPIPKDYVLEMVSDWMAYDLKAKVSGFLFHEQTALYLREVLADLGHITIIKDSKLFNAKYLK